MASSFFFRQDRESEGIFNGVRTARMALSTPIFSSVFIAGEFARVWYPLQPKTCRKCGAECHFAATCNSQCCLNCEKPEHRSEDCPLAPLCRVCLDASHPTTELPFIYYKVSGASYAKTVEQAEDANDQRRMELEEKKRVERERREERARQEERARREKEREMQKEREEEKQRRKEERKQKERDDPRGKDDDHDSDRRNRYVNE